MKLASKRRIGPWTLLERLGKGGNAEVWKAEDGNGYTVAVKILLSQDKGSYPYKRFLSEIKILSSIAGHPGVLPLVEAHVPEHPSIKDPACFSMPVATPITEALTDSPSLTAVVDAIATIAEHLADLSFKGINHRDIKPANLYRYEGRWVIGDFGIARHPDKEALTKAGRKLGPLHFMAPEMLEHPDTADAAPADVYSLAKTLWVLATGQRFPPPGEQRVDVPQMTIRAYNAEPHTQPLDGLIERATRHNPQDRPTMTQTAAELRAWLAPAPAPASPTDVSDIDARIMSITEPATRRDKRVRMQAELADSAFQRFRKTVRPTLEQFASSTRLGDIEEGGLLPRFVWGGHGSKYRDPGYFVVYQNSAYATIKTPGLLGITMKCGVETYLFEDGWIDFVAAYDFGQFGAQNPWINRADMPVGSAQEAHAIVELSNWLVDRLRPALEVFVATVERRAGRV